MYRYALHNMNKTVQPRFEIVLHDDDVTHAYRLLIVADLGVRRFPRFDE